MKDLAETCDDRFRNCKCNIAQRLIDEGKIVCQIDVCPEGCSVCKFCLEEVIEDCTPEPTGKPSFGPTAEPSPHPTPLPTVVPSSLPTFQPTGDPTADLSPHPTLAPTSLASGAPTESASPTPTFDLQKCASYSNQWLHDLDNTCSQDASQENVGTCDCTDAQRRIESGQIECGVARCPDDCEVCKFCLYYVEDCPWTIGSPSTSPSNSPTALPSPAPTPLGSDRPSAIPTESPSRLTENPTQSPTVITDSPSSEPSSSPTTFQLGNCVAYDNDW